MQDRRSRLLQKNTTRAGIPSDSLCKSTPQTARTSNLFLKASESNSTCSMMLCLTIEHWKSFATTTRVKSAFQQEMWKNYRQKRVVVVGSIHSLPTVPPARAPAVETLYPTTVPSSRIALATSERVRPVPLAQMSKALFALTK